MKSKTKVVVIGGGVVGASMLYHLAKKGCSDSVLVERKVKHPIYGKYMIRSTKILAHDEKNECNIGDKVRVMETKPLSKNKRWRLINLIEKAK